jgi:hypothetical protein
MYRVDLRTGTVLTASGAPATRVQLDRSTGLLVPVPLLSSVVLSSTDRAAEPSSDRLDERALVEAVLRLVDRPPPDVHVHPVIHVEVPAPKVDVHVPNMAAPIVNVTVPRTTAVPVRNSLGQIVRVDHLPVDDD